MKTLEHIVGGAGILIIFYCFAWVSGKFIIWYQSYRIKSDASPELLEALEQVNQWLKDTPNNIPFLVRENIAQAIRKAKGEIA